MLGGKKRERKETSGRREKALILTSIREKKKGGEGR